MPPVHPGRYTLVCTLRCTHPLYTPSGTRHPVLPPASLLGLKKRGSWEAEGDLSLLRINLLSPGSLSVMAKKPATESPRAQGGGESLNPYRSDFKPPSRLDLPLSSRFTVGLTLGPGPPDPQLLIKSVKSGVWPDGLLSHPTVKRVFLKTVSFISLSIIVGHSSVF